MKQLSIIFLALVLGGFHLACNDPTLVGSDLLNEEGLNIEFSDTLAIHARTIRGDSIQTLFNGTTNQSVYLLGELNDPFFGFSKANVYTEIHLANATPDYEEAVLDSAVLTISYNDFGFYGDSLESYNVTVYQLAEKLTDYDSLYTNQSLAHEPMPLGQVSGIVINNKDSLLVYDPFLDSLVQVPAHLRIPIDMQWAENILMDTSAVSSDSVFVDLVKGIYLEADVNGEGGYIGLSLGSTAAMSNLSFYYTQADTLANRYDYPLTGRRHVEIAHDYASSTVDLVLDDFALGDSLIFLQSMAGTNIEMKLDGILDLGDVLINKAELEFIVAELPEDNLEFYPPITNMVASKFDESNNLTLIDDVITALNLGLLEQIFGGNLTEIDMNGLVMKKYCINMTQFAIRILAGEEAPDLTISASLKVERPNRSIIFGPGHSIYPARLKLTYTSL